MAHIADDNSYCSSPLAAIDLLEYLHCDSRPTFVVTTRLGPQSKHSKTQLAFCNEALRNVEPLFKVVERLFDNKLRSDYVDATTAEFLSWVRSGPGQDTVWFCDLIWSATTVHRRWTIVSATHLPRNENGYRLRQKVKHRHKPLQASEVMNTRRQVHRKLLHPCKGDTQRIKGQTPNGDFYGIAQSFGVKPSPHNLMVLNFDWAGTPIGPIVTWPQSLRQLVPYLLNDQQPGSILWGQERTLIYNEPYISMIKEFHPGALGASSKVVYAAFWDEAMEPICQDVEANGPSTHENTQVYLDRSGFLEETYFTHTFTPLLGTDNRCRGIDTRVHEVTRQTVVEARMLSLLKIGECTALVTSLGDFWQGLVQAMASNVSDFPLVALYSLEDNKLTGDAIVDKALAPGESEEWFLKGFLGFPIGHPTIPDTLRASSGIGFSPILETLLTNPGPLLCSTKDGTLPANLLHGCDHRGLRAECNQIVICSLHSPSRDIMGFLVLGINPLRPYDDEYKTFVQLLSRQIEASASPVISLVREKQQFDTKTEKSKYEQDLLTKQLEEQTREAQESELRFLRFAEQAPVGVYVLGANGEVKFANDTWYKLLGYPPENQGVHPWRSSIYPDDEQRVEDQWQLFVEGRIQKNFEFRALRQIPGEQDQVIYLRSNSFPELSADGTLKSVTGILIDLTLERAQERAQTDSLMDALEAKKAQEYFMDMVSHEIRNPLHVILQLAEDISSFLEAIRPGGNIPSRMFHKLKDSAEAVDTIMYCAHHQKQILDDVLTLSKLNSDMLTLSPIDVNPASIVSKILKVFDSDIRMSKINTSFRLVGSEPNIQHLNVLMDAGRILQILFNLIGNSIKFMKDRPVRKLTLSVDVTTVKPLNWRVRYIPSGRQHTDPTAAGTWGKSEAVYVQFTIEDTGPGLTVEEMDTLFARFKQASPRTHTQYGGSGLGLFISRELVEMHGGEIGLASDIDKGSTFAFYVKCLASEKGNLEIDTGFDVTKIPTRNGMPARSVSMGELEEQSLLHELPLVKEDTTILIVEDNLVNQKLLCRQLKRLGYKTQTANHGAEALVILKKSTWWHEKSPETLDLALILCDLEMPVMDGMTCVREVRRWQRDGLLSKSVPIVAVTGNARSEQITAAKEAGFDDVISKPYSMDHLVPKIESMTSRKCR